MSLKEYSRKRDFQKTVEPVGEQASPASRQRFVVQKHAASHLHYDFRLEMGGTLKSWAVPKGFPFEKGAKRLAVQVEDHPVSYRDFEGTIPKGQYGGGTVMVWDWGTFEALDGPPEKGLAAGKLHLVLNGKKLQGEWHFVRLRDKKQWLLIRGKNDMRPVSKKADDTSVLSGKTMKQLSESGNIWLSKAAKSEPETPAANEAQKSLPPLKFLEPMKARLALAPPEGDWIYEIKLDGFRTLALKSGSDVRLLSRNEKDFGEKFPEVLDAVAKIPALDAILDGEIVALDSKGRSSFQLLQAHDLGEKRPPIFFYAFDLLRLNGADLRKEPLVARKTKLEQLLKRVPGVLRFSASLTGPVALLLKQTRKLGLEGLMGKRRDSLYEAGRGSGAWIKLKLHHEQEMVIGGCTEPEGSRSHFGALLIGYYDGSSLRFAGKVGTGFTEALLQQLYARFEKISSPKCPFANLPEKTHARYGQSLTAREMQKCHWLKPKLVCQVKFSEWTRDGKLRQPVFLGLREDKNAAEVIRERPS